MYFNSLIRVNSRKARKSGYLPVNLTGEELAGLFASHDQCCDLCGRAENESSKVLCIDHDHDTGEFRGWLCYQCNVGIGKLGDSLRGLLQAVEYLRGG